MRVGLVRGPLLRGHLGQGDVATQPVRPCPVLGGPGAVPLHPPEPRPVKARKVCVGHGVQAAVPPHVASPEGLAALSVEPASSLNRRGSKVGVMPYAMARGLVQPQGSQHSGLSVVTPSTGGVQESVALFCDALQVHRQLLQLGPHSRPIRQPLGPPERRPQCSAARPRGRSITSSHVVRFSGLS